MTLSTWGCSADDDSAASPATVTVTADSGAEDEFADALTDLCSQYCDLLAHQGEACPQGTLNLVPCTITLAQGFDVVNDIADTLPTGWQNDIPPLDAHIDGARDAYDMWISNPDCGAITNINDSGVQRL
ncbi:MAG TPA: hypothetical protein VGN75_16705, partial [Kaistia sp.]|nr:hypothetical protein [Kaistia sp.]